MEWVETTGKTLEEAREAALDQLGVDETDAEFEVLEQPKAGLFGRVRGEARVRARVRPTAPRAKEDRRDRRRRTRNGARDAAGAGRPDGAPNGGAVADVQAKNGTRSAAEASDEAAPAPRSAPDADGPQADGPRPRKRRRRRSGGGGGAGAPSGTTPAEASAGRRPADEADGGQRRQGARDAGGSRNEPDERRDGTEVEVPLQEQARVAEDFLSGLISEFGLKADLAVTERDEENLDLSLSGHDLGLLIGQKGSTLLAVQDLTRTVVQHKTSASNGRIHVDVGGYRQKRAEALAKFAHEVAAKVLQSGQRTALEPMSAPDRKVVHDAITEVEGVTTISEGEDPRRRVVILPSE